MPYRQITHQPLLYIFSAFSGHSVPLSSSQHLAHAANCLRQKSSKWHYILEPVSFKYSYLGIYGRIIFFKAFIFNVNHIKLEF